MVTNTRLFLRSPLLIKPLLMSSVSEACHFSFNQLSFVMHTPCICTYITYNGSIPISSPIFSYITNHCVSIINHSVCFFFSSVCYTRRDSRDTGTNDVLLRSSRRRSYLLANYVDCGETTGKRFFVSNHSPSFSTSLSLLLVVVVVVYILRYPAVDKPP